MPARTFYPVETLTQLLDAGFSLLPVYGVVDGRCQCGRPDCPSPAKHPVSALAPHGVKDASRDPRVIASWFAKAPAINIGIATGLPSGLFVIDVDLPHGPESFEKLGLPAGVEVITGSGGRQHYYRWEPSLDRIFGNKVRLWPGIDIRTTGGYVVAPGSRHIKGGEYRWKA